MHNTPKPEDKHPNGEASPSSAGLETLREDSVEIGDETSECIVRNKPTTSSPMLNAAREAFSSLENTQSIEINFSGVQLQQEPCLLFLSGLQAGCLMPLDFQDGPIVIGRDPEAPIHFDSPEVSRHHIQIEQLDDGTLLLTDLDSKNGTFINNQRVRRCRLRSSDKIQIGAYNIIKLVFQDQDEISCWHQLYRHSVCDWLTGIYNRRHFFNHIQREWAFAQRHQIPISLLMLDIDYFKFVNDTYGHTAGDQVLQELVLRLQRLIRQEDLLARYGGEEFIIFLRDIDRDGAYWQAERIRQEIEASPFGFEGGSLQLTISIGLASHTPNPEGSKGPKDLVKEADQYLYYAKNSGRNRVYG